MGGLVRMVEPHVWLAGRLACCDVHVLLWCGAVEPISSDGNMTAYTKTLIVLWVGLIVALVTFCIWPGPLTLYAALAVLVLIATACVQHRNIQKRNGA
mgnify:FL=1